MNEKIISSLADDIKKDFTLIIHEAALTEDKPYISEARLHNHLQSADPVKQTWIFFCRLQRYILQSAGAIKVQECDAKALTEHLILDFLRTIPRLDLPDPIRDLLLSSKIQIIIILTLSQFTASDELKLILQNDEWKTSPMAGYLLEVMHSAEAMNVAQFNSYLNFRIIHDCCETLNASMKENKHEKEDISSILFSFQTIDGLLSNPAITVNIPHQATRLIPNMDDFFNKFTHYFKEHFLAIQQDPLYTQQMKMVFFNWSYQYLLKQNFKVEIEVFDFFTFLYRTTITPYDTVAKIYSKKYEILRQLYLSASFNNAYILLDTTMGVFYGDPLRIPKNVFNFIALTSYLKDINHYIQNDDHSAAFEFNDLGSKPKEFIKPENCPNEIQPEMQEAIYRLLLNAQRLSSLSTDSALKNQLYTFFKQLKPLLGPEQIVDLEKRFMPSDYELLLNLSLFKTPNNEASSTHPAQSEKAARLGKSRQKSAKANKEKSLKSTSNHVKKTINAQSAIAEQSRIDIPTQVIDFCNRFDNTFYLTGAAVLELYQNQAPKDYDLLAIGISIEKLAQRFDDQKIVYQRIGKNHPILCLNLDANTPLEISCIDHKDTRKTLEEDYLQRDFKPCAMYARIPRTEQGVDITCFNQSLRSCNQKIIATILKPIDCFTADPLRLLRLIKLQIKQPDFRLHSDLNHFLQAKSTSWVELFGNKHSAEQTGFQARFRTALLLLLERFPLNELVKQNLFIDLLADLSQLDTNIVREECLFIHEHSEKMPACIKLLYLVFNLYVKARHEEKDAACPLKDYLLLLYVDRDFFASFEALEHGQEWDGMIFDRTYYHIIERHGFDRKMDPKP